jgi:hypothetical protein
MGKCGRREIVANHRGDPEEQSRRREHEELKAALEASLPMIAIPTTNARQGMTPIYGE